MESLKGKKIKSTEIAILINSLRPEYNFRQLLKYFNLKRKTYYAALKRSKKPDKYLKLKEEIKNIYLKSRETYGYRRIWQILINKGYTYCLETVRRIMRKIGLICTVYSKKTRKYSSFKGEIGKIAPNILKQKFNETIPYKVLHTDITQVKIGKNKWGYISAIIDEASGEVLATSISEHPNWRLVSDMLDKLSMNLPQNSKPLIHSDQGFHYQLKSYRQKLKSNGYMQSMSRKGNCLDNAPIESFFNLLKRECLNRININSVITLKNTYKKYVDWFNNERISGNKKGLTPVEYRCKSLKI
ncbi:IS3 family transposase [Fructilactobacillus vespulae]|uniref:IS3 family transposase n=1 Tax=Fructilactobacillus vespulae TaxID=1249630 RepID=UPI0039B68EBD